MKKIKVFIVTYKRQDILNDTVNTLLNKTDFKDYENTEVTIINNHSDFYLEEDLLEKVTVLHNDCRPDWDCGNLARSWNEGLLHGFRDLNNPDSEFVVLMQNDIVLEKNWVSNLLKMHEKYTFITGRLGDNILSFHADAIKKIGIFDERFTCPSHKEADFYLRALLYNADKTLINDVAHGRLWNENDALPLDRNIYRGAATGWIEHKNTGLPLEAFLHSTQYFYYKWKGTWEHGDPEYQGWVVNWSDGFKSQPPSAPMVDQFIQYYYFEKDVEDLGKKGYVGWRQGDMWFTSQTKGDIIDPHPNYPKRTFR